jgi:uncharacterized membrane protein YhaH (DUF805 family)
VGFADAVKNCLSRYAAFNGRARRSEYWWFYLFVSLLYLAAVAVEAVLGIATPILQLIVIAAILIPMLAVSVRRLHDTGRSAWWLLISFVPLIGGIWMFVLTVLDSEPGENEYGPSPKPQPAWDAAPWESAGDARQEPQSADMETRLSRGQR